MRVQQLILKNRAGIDAALEPLSAMAPDLVLVFGACAYFATAELTAALRRQMPGAVIAGCSTAGEIAGKRVYDDSCVITAIRFARTTVAIADAIICDMADSHDTGARLAQALPQEGLTAVFMLGTGVAINGSALIAGLQANLPPGVTISGGLAADGGAFRQTWTLGPRGAADNTVVAVGLYGEHIRLGYGSHAGWEAFGPARKVTRCVGNVLYGLDGARALDIYKLYLGDHARDLPGSGLLFPFEMLSAAHEKSNVFRTILAVDEEQGSLTLAGDILADGYLKLMHSSTNRLIDGAETAARGVRHHADAAGDQLALLVSCVGRKLVMG
ncbi:MAG: FIST N-terminal domain-containing protein, partial [Janthinobacterium sp.]